MTDTTPRTSAAQIGQMILEMSFGEVMKLTDAINAGSHGKRKVVTGEALITAANIVTGVIEAPAEPPKAPKPAKK